MDPRKKICSFCRLILPSDFQYCPMCGEPLADEHSQRAPPYETPQEEENPIFLDRIGGTLFSPTRKKIVIAGALLALVLLMAAAIVGVSMYQKPNSEASVVETTATTTPTIEPTIAPTPTAYPTESPTATPTEYPMPTVYPTDYPTPTPYPSPSPTYNPWATPSPSPTYNPWATPSPSPRF